MLSTGPPGFGASHSELLKIMKEKEDTMEKNLMHKADAFGYLYKNHQKELRALIEKIRTKNWRAP